VPANKRFRSVTCDLLRRAANCLKEGQNSLGTLHSESDLLTDVTKVYRKLIVKKLKYVNILN
jgi:hypothetical protein